ncbi:hypothetical protein BU14_0686s0004 [Porphyra umbilicalis]|uniref:Uncharacterized protein n=1 Tax=Porphyra umbilicalis TaxID=2786 RepID=A0A1X6NQ44_PORUM|nr:hypothetical protein BU14_0686s0004 [Porphyra umbilicalis]|eukprot:OSX70702.1 hypothetical protein BU14_0686s0004 [Porphyra umbilicalis]
MRLGADARLRIVDGVLKHERVVRGNRLAQVRGGAVGERPPVGRRPHPPRRHNRGRVRRNGAVPVAPRKRRVAREARRVARKVLLRVGNGRAGSVRPAPAAAGAATPVAARRRAAPRRAATRVTAAAATPPPPAAADHHPRLGGGAEEVWVPRARHAAPLQRRHRIVCPPRRDERRVQAVPALWPPPVRLDAPRRVAHRAGGRLHSLPAGLPVGPPVGGEDVGGGGEGFGLRHPRGAAVGEEPPVGRRARRLPRLDARRVGGEGGGPVSLLEGRVAGQAVGLGLIHGPTTGAG